ncbi:MAG: hypothetical protein N2C14_27810, partial [Planctomycetales bacterium]
ERMMGGGIEIVNGYGVAAYGIAAAASLLYFHLAYLVWFKWQSSYDRALAGSMLTALPYQPGVFDLGMRMIFSVGYLGVIALGASEVSGRGFWATLLVLGCSLAIFSAIMLYMTVGWAMKDDKRSRQFGMKSLFLWMILAAVFLGVMRFLIPPDVVGAGEGMFTGRVPSLDGGTPPFATMGQVELFILYTVVGLFVLCVSVPALVALTDGLVWIAAWTVRSPRLAALIRKLT